MRLKDLEIYTSITIQAHDNPDADAIASGYALYRYFKSKGKKVSLIYSGRYRIKKTDLKLMIEKLHIPIKYRAARDEKIEGVLLTVDCQYGAGNVQKLNAENMAVIDHHEREISTAGLVGYEINPNLGSCATLVWQLLVSEDYPINDDKKLGTALYYGLYRDTNQFTELFYPLDRDMREAVATDKKVLHLLKNSNLTLEELEIAGIALIKYIYNNDFHYAIIQTKPCDPNLLGIISDFIIQVDEIYTCVVFNHTQEGYKYSVRSCIREVRANELAQFLAQDIGTGGGHAERAGGFLSERKYEQYYPVLHSEAYFGNKMNEYFESYDIIDLGKCKPDIAGMDMYESKKNNIGYVEAAALLPVGAQCVLRSLSGDMELLIDEGVYILVGENSRVRVTSKTEFESEYRKLSDSYGETLEYAPKLKVKDSADDIDLLDYMKLCTNKKITKVYAKQLTRGVKLFAPKSDEYMLGEIGDYLIADCGRTHSMSIVEQGMFGRLYQKI